MPIVALDKRLNELVDPEAKIDQIATGYAFTEGPVWNSQEQHLTFTDFRNEAIHRWTEAGGARLFRQPSGAANGETYDKDGFLICCEHSGRRVSRTLPDGHVHTLADNYEGKRLSSPNDIVGMTNGDLIFTDPPYGLRQPDGSFAPQDIPFQGVFRLAVDGRLTLLTNDLER